MRRWWDRVCRFRHRVFFLMAKKITVRMQTAVAGSLTAKPGDIVSIDSVYALKLIDRGDAEHVDVDRIPTAGLEAATVAPTEVATMSKAKPRVRKKRRG